MAAVDLLSLATQKIRPFESIPIIDISGLSGDASSKAQVASAIREACIHVGFFYVKNHGIDETVIKSTVEAARRFFDLSLEEKMKIEVHKSPNFKGYTPLLGENTNPENRGDLHEGFDIGPEIDHSSNSSMSGSNVWPPEDVIPGFQEAVLNYYKEVIGLGLKLFPAFALALNLPEDFFDDKVQTAAAIMRLLHYPPQTGMVDDRVQGIGAHTDYECFTILWQDDIPALQVLNTSGQWVDAKPMPGTFVINIADQLSRWTSDRVSFNRL